MTPLKDLEHTPGPWVAGENRVYSNCKASQPIICDLMNKAGISYYDSTANAILISKAPTLLALVKEAREALKELLPMALAAYNHSVAKGSHEEFLKEDRSAMVKALSLLSKIYKTLES